MIFQGDIQRKWCLGLTIAVFIIILMFGLNPQDFNFKNGAAWIQDMPGIHFENYGIAYAPLPQKTAGEKVTPLDCRSFELALRPEGFDQEGFKFILAFHDGNDQDQFIISQWRSTLIVMNDDDYENKRKSKRITARKPYQLLRKVFLTLVTGERGTILYIDGRIAAEKKNLALKIPQSGSVTQLILGNSVYGKHSWRGDVYGLALYRSEIKPEDVALHYEKWLENQNFSFKRSVKPILLYPLDEGDGARAIDHGVGNHNLIIPKRMHILKKKILESSFHHFRVDRKFLYDVLINVLGFVPLGFFMAATFMAYGRVPAIGTMLITVGLCFATSLSIEIAQAWLPSRASSMLDLLLNTAGGFIGAVVSIRFKPFSRMWVQCSE